MINVRRIYGGVYTPPLRFSFISDFVLKDKKTIFRKCYQNYLGHLWFKFFTFSDKWKVVSVVSQRGGVHPPINLEVFFTHILATATRLNTL